MKQESREALIELMFLALYLDGHVSVDEDDMINRGLDTLGWEADETREDFVYQAFFKAREGASCELKTAEFLDARLSVIESDGAQAGAFTWLTKVLSSDGLTPDEVRLLRQIELRLFPGL